MKPPYLFLLTVLFAFTALRADAQISNVPITSSSEGLALETSLCAVRDDTGALHLIIHVMIDTSTGAVNYHSSVFVSSNGGASWSETAQWWGRGVSQIYDPGCELDALTGRAYATSSDNNVSWLEKVGLRSSTDWGNHWDTSRTVIQIDTSHGTPSGGADFPVIAFRRLSTNSAHDTVYVAYTWGDGTTSTEHVFRSANQGASFAEWGTISISPNAGGVQMFIGNNGTVYLMALTTLWKRTPSATSWTRVDSISIASIAPDSSHHTGVVNSFSGAPDTAYVCTAYVKPNGSIAFRGAFSPFALSSATERIVDTAASGDTMYVPRVVVDSQRRYIAVSYASPTDSNSNFYNLKLAVSTDFGSHWSRVVVSDTPSSWDHSGSTLPRPFIDFFGMAVLDSVRVGVAWSDKRGSRMVTHFAAVQIGTMFLNNFDNVSAYRLTYFPTGSPSDSQTVGSGASRIVTNGASYTVHPDSNFHFDVATPKNNFAFGSWLSAGSVVDTNFSHAFTGQGLTPQVLTAHFAHIDRLDARNDLEGSTSGTMKWGSGHATPPSTVVTSAFVIDTALRYKEYDYSTRNWFDSVYSTYWWFEHWTKNGLPITDLFSISGTDTTHSLLSVADTGATRIYAQFKGHLRSADSLSAFDFNNSRKSCYSKPEHRHFLVYSSRGNIYLDSSTNDGFCDFYRERLMNTTYGNAGHPGIAYLDRPDSVTTPVTTFPSRTLFVVWDGSAKNRMGKKRGCLGCKSGVARLSESRHHVAPRPRNAEPMPIPGLSGEATCSLGHSLEGSANWFPKCGSEPALPTRFLVEPFLYRCK
jgi:hypothetical protein